MKQYDVVVVGAGAVGATLALALGQLGKKVLLIEKNAHLSSAIDNFSEGKTFALSYASAKIYQALNIWQDLQPYVGLIKEVLVNMQGQYGSCRLNHAETSVSALGYVIGANRLEATLNQAIANYPLIDVIYSTQIEHSALDTSHWCVEMITESSHRFSVQTQLIVASDGAHSFLRQRMFIDSNETDYGHGAVMCNLLLPNAPVGLALERFLTEGAIAILPWRAGWATCVWTLPIEKAKYFQNTSIDEFVSCCQQSLGTQFGKIKDVGQRQFFPLKMKLAHQQFGQRFLLMGNAAHSLHPIAAQGLNLSLRDIWQLRMQLKQNECSDMGSKAFIENYIVARKNDQNRVIMATDKIARFMANNRLAARWRALGLVCFDQLFPAKQLFTQYSMGMN